MRGDRVCECGHRAQEHLEGTGLGTGCSGDVIIQNPGQSDVIARCSCAAFVLWYSDPPGGAMNPEDVRPTFWTVQVTLPRGEKVNVGAFISERHAYQFENVTNLATSVSPVYQADDFTAWLESVEL